MGADAFHVFFGIRLTIQSEDELTGLENRTDARMAAARKARLQTCIGRPTDGQQHYLLIGCQIGTFGVENQVEATLSDVEYRSIVQETTHRLEAAGFDPLEAKLHFQLEAQY